MQIVSQNFLELGKDENGDINASQALLLDVDKSQSWEESVLAKQISDARAELFVLLRGVDDKQTQDRVIENYKKIQKFRKGEYDAVALEVKKESLEQRASTAQEVTIYCDGGCVPNPGESGSGISVYKDGVLSELLYGLYEPMGTNNTAELGALYKSLQIAQEESQKGSGVEIKCDSMYAINCIATWAVSWERNGWKKKGGEIKNLEIIQKAYKLYNTIKKDVKLSHIKAHAGYEGNELADRMTMYAREQKSRDFQKYHDIADVASILKMRAG